MLKIGGKILNLLLGTKSFLKITPMKGVLRFEKKRKLSSWFIESFDILEGVRDVPYHIGLLPKLSM